MLFPTFEDDDQLRVLVMYRGFRSKAISSYFVSNDLVPVDVEKIDGMTVASSTSSVEMASTR